MQKINLLILFMFIIGINNLISYEIKKDEIIKVKTLMLSKNPEYNFPVKKEDENKNPFEILRIGLENFINQVGPENIFEVKTLSHLIGTGFVVIYKEKKK
ncbi:hypothetical protein QIA41_06180 (plasmid) [Borreliella sinica]|uniref:hypothetical protein n=1 Tax=Borreliella sinica TaxID=87162 RepID=UPI003AF02CEB